MPDDGVDESDTNANSPMDQQNLDLEEASEYTGLSQATLKRYTEADRLEATHTSASEGGISISKSELDKVLQTSDQIDTENDQDSSSEATENGKASRSLEGEAPTGGQWTVINADVIDGLRRIESGSVNCIVTSPPYYWQRDYEVEGQLGHEEQIEGYVEAIRDAFSEAWRVLADDGVVFLNIGDGYYSAKGQPHGEDKKHSARQFAREKLRAVDGSGLGLPRKSLIGMPWRVARALQEDGWTLRSDIIWKRPAPMPEPTAKDRPWGCYEHVFLLSKNARYWFDRDALVEKQGHWDIWTISARPENPGSHFAPFPREFARLCIECGCPEEGVVLDPFVGSGTTMLEALQKGNNAIGIDIKEEYCDFVKDRIDREEWTDENIPNRPDAESEEDEELSTPQNGQPALFDKDEQD